MNEIDILYLGAVHIRGNGVHISLFTHTITCTHLSIIRHEATRETIQMITTKYICVSVESNPKVLDSSL